MKHPGLIAAGLSFFLFGIAHSALAGVVANPVELSDMLEHNRQAGEKIDASMELFKAGDAYASNGNWKQAREFYGKALEKWKDSPYALYGMVRCCQAAGDTTGEINFYHQLVYSTNPADKGFRENDTSRLLDFALLLDKTKQSAEAASVYNHAAALLNGMDDKPQFPVPLPTFGPGLDQLGYTPQLLQAMVHIGLGVPSLYNQETTDKDKLAHLREAVRLAPDSAVAYYHLGQQLHRMGDKGERAAFEAAAQLGDDQTAAIAEEAAQNCH